VRESHEIPLTDAKLFRSRCLASSAIAPAVPQLLDEFGVDNTEIGTLVVTIEVCVNATLFLVGMEIADAFLS
jgi:hypothetical protein